MASIYLKWWGRGCDPLGSTSTVSEMVSDLILQMIFQPASSLEDNVYLPVKSVQFKFIALLHYYHADPTASLVIEHLRIR